MPIKCLITYEYIKSHYALLNESSLKTSENALYSIKLKLSKNHFLKCIFKNKKIMKFILKSLLRDQFFIHLNQAELQRLLIKYYKEQLCSTIISFSILQSTQLNLLDGLQMDNLKKCQFGQKQFIAISNSISVGYQDMCRFIPGLPYYPGIIPKYASLQLQQIRNNQKNNENREKRRQPLLYKQLAKYNQEKIRLLIKNNSSIIQAVILDFMMFKMFFYQYL